MQEWAGAALAVESLSREERKALLLTGPSRTGKTEVSRVFRHMLGEPIAAPSIADLSSHDNKFGLETLYGAAAWIRDDAINEGDKLDPQRFKTIVTGEPIDIQRKGRGNARGVKFAIPVLLTTNSLPKARDVSDAIFNRSLVLDMNNVVTEAEAHEVRREKGVPAGETIGSHIVKAEAPGVLNWALAGLQRLMARGQYDPPLSVRMATQRFKDDNNPVSEWIREAVEQDRFCKVSRADLLCAYHGWQREQDGDEAQGDRGQGVLAADADADAVGQRDQGHRCEKLQRDPVDGRRPAVLGGSQAGTTTQGRQLGQFAGAWRRQQTIHAEGGRRPPRAYRRRQVQGAVLRGQDDVPRGPF